MPRRLEVVLGLLGDVARVAAVGLPGDGIADLADQRQRRRRVEGVDPRRRRVGDHQHVACVDRLPPADRRAVEADAVLEHLLVERAIGGTVVCCQMPGRSMNLKSTNLQPSSLSPRTRHDVPSMHVVALRSHPSQRPRRRARWRLLRARRCGCGRPLRPARRRSCRRRFDRSWRCFSNGVDARRSTSRRHRARPRS